MRKLASLTVLATGSLLVTGLTSAAWCQERAFALDDLFALRTLAAVEPLPDGGIVAVVVQRSWSDPITFRPYDMAGFDQSDVWLVNMESGEVDNVTGGHADGSGYWNPVWSPDGRKLALHSTRGGDNVRLYVLDVASRRITRVTEQGIDLRSGHFGTTPWRNPLLNSLLNPVHWLDSNRLLVTLLPSGEQPHQFRIRRQTPNLATRGWRAAHDGATHTASVLDTQDATQDAPPPVVPSQLVLVDLASGSQRVLIEGDIRDVLVAPDGGHALVVQAVSPPGVASSSHRLGVITLEDEPEITWLDEIAEPVALFGRSAHRFSPNGATLAVLGRAANSETTVAQLVDLRSFAVRPVAENVAAEELAWVHDQLLIRGRDHSGDARTNWWVAWNGADTLMPDAPARNLTGALPEAPAAVVEPAADGRILTIADGELWSVSLSDGAPALLTGGLDGRVTALTRQPRPSSHGQTFVVVTSDGSQRSHHHLDLSGPSAAFTPVTVPEGASVAVHEPTHERVLAWIPNGAHGSFLWTGTVHDGAMRRLLAFNEHLAELAPHRRLLVEYEGEDGQPLQAVVMMPPAVDDAPPPPAVFWVYPGYEVQGTAPYWMTLNHAHADNLNVLAGAGYAVAIPSMPLGPPPRKDLLEQTTAGVLPLLDRLGELALVDTARVAVMGQSFGGYGVLALIGQTNRFRTAAAMDGFANLASLFGTFDARTRYTSTPHLDLVQASFLTGPVLGVGETPWDDPERYWRNSPLAHVSAVETPVLLVQGDLDYVPMQQSEEYFAALQWLGKPARFVRYWGESHGVNAAANIRDRWLRILEWLRETMPPATGHRMEDSPR